MITTIRTCDRCKKTMAANDQLWRIGITMNSERYGNGNLQMSVDWCRPCAQTYGLLATPTNEAKPVLPPTIAEQLEAVVREMVGEIVREELAQ